MSTLTKEQLEQELNKRFGNAKPEFLAAAKEIGQLLAQGEDRLAKEFFDKYRNDQKMVMWESLALSDASSIYRTIEGFQE